MNSNKNKPDYDQLNSLHRQLDHKISSTKKLVLSWLPKSSLIPSPLPSPTSTLQLYSKPTSLQNKANARIKGSLTKKSDTKVVGSNKKEIDSDDEQESKESHSRKRSSQSTDVLSQYLNRSSKKKRK